MSIETGCFYNNILGLRISKFESGKYENSKYEKVEYLVKYQGTIIRSFSNKEKAEGFVYGIIYQTGRFLVENDGPY